MASTQPSPELRPAALSEGVFATGTSDDIVNHIREILPDAAPSGDDFWVRKSNRMLKGVLEAMVWLRDEGMIDIDAMEIREFLALQRVIDLADKDKFPDMPEGIRIDIQGYLETLPGFDRSRVARDQEVPTHDIHGALSIQFSKELERFSRVN